MFESVINRVTRGALIAFWLVVTANIPAFAQGTTTSISGTVVDAAGGAVPGATVVVKNNSGATFETVTNGEGVFNVPGYDTLPLSEATRKWGTSSLPLPGPLVAPLYGLRHRLTGSEFTYGLNRRTMHFGLVLDGTRARDVLGYVPRHPVDWPVGGPVLH